MVAASGLDDVDALIVDMNPSQILDLMANWPEIDNLAEMTFYDGGRWVSIDADARDVLQAEPFVAFEHVEIGEEMRAEGERMNVSRTDVYWTANEKHSGIEVHSHLLTAHQLRELRTGMELMDESIRAHTHT